MDVNAESLEASREAVLVYTTFPSVAAAKEAGTALVQAKLAACVNILPGMTSVYAWKGQIEEAVEAVMIVKTRQALAGAVAAEVQRRHAYECPAILVLPVEGGSRRYLEWLFAETEGAGEETARRNG